MSAKLVVEQAIDQVSRAQGKVFRELIHNQRYELIFLTRELDQFNAGATRAKSAGVLHRTRSSYRL